MQKLVSMTAIPNSETGNWDVEYLYADGSVRNVTAKNVITILSPEKRNSIDDLRESQ